MAATATSATTASSSWKSNQMDTNAGGAVNTSSSPPSRTFPNSEIPSSSTERHQILRGEGTSLVFLETTTPFNNAREETSTNSTPVVPSAVAEEDETAATTRQYLQAAAQPPSPASTESAGRNHTVAAVKAGTDNDAISVGVVVDSALLAAFREPRERIALLRLESLLVDFCRCETAGWLEVSGPYNSTWIGPQHLVSSSSSSSNPRASTALNGGTATAESATAPVPGMGMGPWGGASSWGQHGGRYAPFGSAPGELGSYGASWPASAGLLAPSPSSSSPVAPSSSSAVRPATSFQRCVLHRLADRFGIVRENGSVLEGSIRLVKLPNTRIPSRLLRDMDLLSDYSNSSSAAGPPGPQQTTSVVHPTDRGAPAFCSSSSPSSSLAMGELMGALSQTAIGGDNLNSPGGAGSDAATATTTTARTAPQQQQPRPSFASRKMKIMKRTDRSRSWTPATQGSAALSSCDADGGSTSGSGGSKKALLTRTASTTLGTDLSDKERAYAEARARIFNGADSDGDGGGEHDDGSGLDDGTSPASTPALAFAAAAAAACTSNLPSPLRGTENLSAGQAPAPASVPVAENKATYRNRVEEAADPDFKRGVVGVTVPLHHHPATYLGHAPMMMTTTTNLAASSALSSSSLSSTTTAPYLQPHSLYANYPAAPQLSAGYQASSTGPNGFVTPAAPAPTYASPVSGKSSNSIVTNTAQPLSSSSSSSSRTSTPKLAADAPAFYPRWLTSAATPTAPSPAPPSHISASAPSPDRVDSSSAPSKDPGEAARPRPEGGSLLPSPATQN
jgi:hypothetical protein